VGKGEKGALIGLGKVRGLMEVSALASAGKFVALTTSKVVKQWVDVRACLSRQLSRALIEP
jgi:hypothetical protein